MLHANFNSLRDLASFILLPGEPEISDEQKFRYLTLADLYAHWSGDATDTCPWPSGVMQLLKKIPDFEFDETNSERVYLEKLKAREELEAANAVNGTHPEVPVPTVSESVREMCYGKGGSCTSVPIDVKAVATKSKVDWDDSLSDL
jgi:hypothetical protein